MPRIQPEEIRFDNPKNPIFGINKNKTTHSDISPHSFPMFGNHAPPVSELRKRSDDTEKG